MEEVKFVQAGTEAINVTDVSDKFLSKPNFKYKEFVYTDEYIEECSEMGLPIYIAMIVGIAFVVVALIVVVAVITSVRYKKKYYQLMDERSGQKGAKESSPENLDKP